MHDISNHVEPVGRFEQLWLNVPVSSGDPKSFDGLEANGSLLKDAHVRAGQALSIFEVNTKHVNAPFANSRNPRTLQPVLQVHV